MPLDVAALQLHAVRAITEIRPVSDSAATPPTVPWTVTPPDATAFPDQVLLDWLTLTLPVFWSVAVNLHPVIASEPPVAEAVQDTGNDDARVIVAGVQLTLMRGALRKPTSML